MQSWHCFLILNVFSVEQLILSITSGDKIWGGQQGNQISQEKKCTISMHLSNSLPEELGVLYPLINLAIWLTMLMVNMVNISYIVNMI